MLTMAYPGHPWAVRVYDGGFFIRHLGFPKNWGMNAKAKDFAHDAAVLKRQIIFMAGEWLERANLKRGRENGDEIKHLDGAPESDQPGRPLILGPDAKVVGVESNEQMRNTPRPQAIIQSA